MRCARSCRPTIENIHCRTRRRFEYGENKVVRLAKFAYVSSCGTPAVKKRVANGFAKINNEGCRIVQGAVAMKSFYGSSERRYDTVLVHEENREDSFENRERSGKD